MAEESALGRRSKLTTTRIDTITSLLRSGNFLSVAAEAAGVGERTVYEWLERGELPEEIEQDTLYAQFSQAVQRAQAEAEQVLVASIERAATGFTRKTTTTKRYRDPETGREVEEVTVEEAQVFDWRAAAWLLQMRHKKRWAMKPPTEVDAEEEHVKVLIVGQEPPRLPAAGLAETVDDLFAP